MDTVQRIQERLKDCDVVLVNDKWKHNYKEDVSELVQGIMQIQAQAQMIQSSNMMQAQLLDYLVSQIEEIKDLCEEDQVNQVILDKCTDVLTKIDDIFKEQPNGQ